MTPRDIWQKHGWLILLAVIILLLLAATELLPAGQASRLWIELIHGG